MQLREIYVQLYLSDSLQLSSRLAAAAAAELWVLRQFPISTPNYFSHFISTVNITF